ncbi:hypothetical protein [Reichenbachiella sp. MSK19-1]|uniref:hypothetical protein n=1 Tax=Reichenbachiella sp. MSK19-1 TaxID=1897631 RepID=UPI000EE0B485|nr:hypothetical protein [Reichenbachiella sp. MSK19-1]RJE73097.1 hypothetical protein BGP76_03915 [Reichenbachiella sp. MSK19-1]
MKKVSLSLLSLVIFVMVSCSPEENPFETSVGIAIIEGKVQFDDDLTDSEDIMVAAEGAKIKISYSSHDLSFSQPNGVDVTKVIDVTVDDEGRFTVEVPAISNDVSYTVSGLDFLTEYTGYDEDFDEETKTGFYSANPQTISLTEGETKYVIIDYTFTSEF